MSRVEFFSYQFRVQTYGILSPVLSDISFHSFSKSKFIFIQKGYACFYTCIPVDFEYVFIPICNCECWLCTARTYGYEKHIKFRPQQYKHAPHGDTGRPGGRADTAVDGRPIIEVGVQFIGIESRKISSHNG